MKPAFSYFIAVSITGLMSTATAKEPTPVRFQLPADEASIWSERLKGAKQPSLSIAMSGGGIRSSLFNIGVLKAFYDHHRLADVDLISSVSGGSYTSYWLYSNQMADPKEKFGYRALDDKHFPERVCEIITASNFVTFGKMATHIFSARQMYLNSLKRTFGEGGDLIPISTLESHVRSGQVPYLIINATTFGRDEEKRNWADRLFEFTPSHYGNVVRGFVPWGDRRHMLSEAAVTSGAAISLLRRTFSQPYPGSGPNEVVKLWDGGKTENLGAVAPLLRGTKELIIIDAQLDRASEPFEAYFNLIKRLNSFGITVEIGEINRDRKQAEAVFTGSATSTENTSSITYLKMRIPEWFRQEVADPQNQRNLDNGRTFKEEYLRRLKASEMDGNWNCTSVAGLHGDYRAWLRFDTASYMGWSKTPGPYLTLTRSLPGQQEFPEFATIDQSFYLDQAVAYIGLGYVIAERALSKEGRSLAVE